MKDATRHADWIGPALLGALGLLPGIAGAPDPVAALGWMSSISIACGWFTGARELRLLPHAAAVPGTWALCFLFAQTGAARELPFPLYGMGVVAGLYAGGYALGRFFARAPWAGAGLCVLLNLVLVGLPFQGGFAAEKGAEASWAKEYPGWSAWVLDASPLVLTLESAGWDVTREHPALYRRSGVEWFPRRPWQGKLAAPTVLVVGFSLAVVASMLRRGREPSGIS